MPQYYNRLMIGSIVDQGIFEDLIAEKLPVLSKHLNRLEVPIAPITMPWFLLLFVGVLPVDVSRNIASGSDLTSTLTGVIESSGQLLRQRR